MFANVHGQAEKEPTKAGEIVSGGPQLIVLDSHLNPPDKHPKPRTNPPRSRAGKGRGSVYQDKKTGYWIAQVHDGQRDNGKPKYRRVKRRSEAAAIEALTDMLSKKKAGRLLVTSTLTVGAWLDTWLEDYVKPHNRPGTYRSYEQIVRLWIKPSLGKIALKNLKPTNIDQLLTRAKRGELSSGKEKPLSLDSVRLIRSTLRRALAIAVKKEKIGENPVLRTETQKMAVREVAHFSTEQAAKLLDKRGESHYGNLVAFALCTGLRVGEAIGLTWANVDLDNKQIRVTHQLQRLDKKFVLTDLKTGSKARRALALPDLAIEVLKGEKEKASGRSTGKMTEGQRLDLVFTSPTGEPHHARTVDEKLKALCAEAKVPAVSFHKLRHTVATSMAEAGVPLDVIRDQLGHSQIALTANTYRHFVPAKQKEAVETLGNLYAAAAEANRKSEQQT